MAEDMENFDLDYLDKQLAKAQTAIGESEIIKQEKSLTERLEDLRKQATKIIIEDSVGAVIIMIVQKIFDTVYSIGSAIIIHMMNIKYNQEFYDTVALTTILYQSFAVFLPIFIISFFIENPTAELYVLIALIIINDMGYLQLFQFWWRQVWIDRKVRKYTK